MEARIDHARSAQDHIDWAHEQQGAEGQFEFTVRDNALIAQAHATLALVEQQRIANLIAVNEHNEDVTPEGGFIQVTRLRAEVRVGLGL